MRTRRVPFIRQLSDAECGPACLAMVLSHHGRATSVAELREQVVAGRDGVTAGALLRVADAEGLIGRGVEVSATALPEISVPAILHWRGCHYVVLEGMKGGQARIVDPAFGRRTVSPPELSENFSGTAMEFRPGDAFRPRAADRWAKTLGILGALFREAQHRQLLAAAIVLSGVLQCFALAVPALTAWIVDGTGLTLTGVSVPAIAAAVCALVLGRTAIGYVRSIAGARLQRALDAQVSVAFFEHLLKLPFSFFQQRSTGDLLLRLSSLGAIRDAFTTQLQTLCLDVPTAVLYLALLVAVSPLLALVAVGAAAVQTLLIAYAAHRQQDIAARMLTARSNEQGCTVEILSGITFVKASAAERRMVARWRSVFDRQLEVGYEYARFSARLEAVLGSLRFGTPLVALIVGTMEVQRGRMTMGVMLAAASLVGLFVQPVLTLLQSMQTLQLVLAYVDRVADVLDTAPERSGGVALTEPRTPRSSRLRSRHGIGRGRAIECRNVGFGFAHVGDDRLSDVSFRIDPGRKLAIIGPTGSGKSTLVKVLLGLWSPTTGAVLHDDVDLREIDLTALRSRSGVVLQEPDIFGGTIRENIAMRRPDASMDEIRAAARMACLEAEVLAMPLRYETSVGDRGTALSGGQRQRLALARALIDAPDLLILDEATNHLDVHTEAKVDAVVAELGCTRIVVSHRLSAVENADWVILLDAGRITAQGEPKEVLPSFLRGRSAAGSAVRCRRTSSLTKEQA